MEALAAKTEGLSKDDRLQLDFGLGKAYADLKDYPRSFKHYLSGNASKRAGIAYDEAATLQLFDCIEAVFSKQLIAAKSGGGDPSATPIFVIGMPRSGTTLIEQIIASHPLAHGAGELQTLNDVILEVRGTDGHPLPFRISLRPAGRNAGALRQIGARYLALVRQLATKQSPSHPSPASGEGWEGARNTSPTKCRRIIISQALSIWRLPACENHSFDARSGRHLHLLLLETIFRRAEPHLRSRRAWPLLQTLRTTDGALARGCCRRAACSTCNTRRWSAIWKPRRAASSPIAACPGTMPASPSTKPTARCGPPALPQVRQPIYKSAVGRWRVYEKDLGPLLGALGR